MSLSYDPCEPSPLMLWDTVWNNETGGADWELTSGALRADSMLATSIWLCLFTDRRAPPDATPPNETDDRRGWFGDFVDVQRATGETEMGSLIWLYERSALTEDTINGIEDAANEALQPLVTLGMAASIEATVEIDKIKGACEIKVQVRAKDGAQEFDQRFSRVWSQVY